MDDATELLAEAFVRLGLQAQATAGADGGRAELVLDPDGVATTVEVQRRSLVTEDVAARLLAEVEVRGAVVVVVGDRVTDAARRVLTSRRGGYLDLRGRLALRADRVLIDTDVEPLRTRESRTSALSGKAGLEVATALLRQPSRPVAVRQLARELTRSASTVSEVLAVLRRDGLVDDRNAVTDTRLFWQVAERWRTTPTYLAQVPSADDRTTSQALRLGTDVGDVDAAEGWALTDAVAAAAYGAPAAIRTGQTLHFYVRDAALVRRATTILGASTSVADARCAVRVAPVPAVCRHRVAPSPPQAEWPLAHPVFVALDLAQDAGRGREILEGWTPGERWPRVW